MKHMKVNGTNQKVFFQEDLDRIRRKMRIGDRIETYVYRNRLGEVIEKPRKITRTVVGIYPHLVELESKTAYPKRITMTYVDMLLGKINKGGKKNV